MDRRLLRCTALQAGAFLAYVLPAHAQPAPNARPTGGAVTAGSASIAASPNTTTISQSTQRAAINWQSFDIGSQQAVQFRQPSPSAMTLNRVVGPNPSQIAGRIDANGQVVITNQSGVTFYRGSQVNTAGLMVTAAGISNANFMAGRMVFDRAPDPDARVANAGTLTVHDAGLAALVAPQVSNSGVITARLGHVVLAGARTATLDLYGDGLMALDVTHEVTRAPNGATALVTNSGIIRADGGTVQLTAREADGLVQTLVEAGGTVRADTVGARSGTIVLNGVGGDIRVAGQLTATGTAAGTRGGNIMVNASGAVDIAAGARLNASGTAGGGVIAIGTTLARAKGGPGVASPNTAAGVTVAQGATIAANATRKGNGGRVTVLSGGGTVMHGAIAAKGGPHGGDGGFVEVSGNTLGMNGTVSLAAPAGTIGTLLLDPTNLDVVPRVGTLDELLPSIGYADGSTNDTVSNRAIDDSDANVILQATHNLTVDPKTPITLLPGVSLTLQTQTGNVVVSAGSPITASGGGGLTLQAGHTVGSGGTLTLNDNLTTDAAGQIVLSADAGIALNAVTVTTGALALATTTSGGVSQGAAGRVAAATLQAAVTGDLSLTSGNNAIGTLGPVVVSNGNLAVTTGGALTITGPVAATFMNITATGRMTLAGNLVTVGAPLAQQSGATPAPEGSTLTVLAPIGSNGGTGASFVQTGAAVIDPPGTTVRIQLPAAGGSATFNNLLAQAATVVLGLGSGTATGAMQAGGLLVLGSGGSAALTGSVAGVPTAAAAAAGQIAPAVDANYTFNGCTIGLAACAPPPVPPPGGPEGNPGGPTVNPNLPPVPTITETSALPQSQPVLGGLLQFLPGTHPPLVPTLEAPNLIVLPTPPLLAQQLVPTDVVPPNISFEDY